MPEKVQPALRLISFWQSVDLPDMLLPTRGNCRLVSGVRFLAISSSWAALRTPSVATGDKLVTGVVSKICIKSSRLRFCSAACKALAPGLATARLLLPPAPFPAAPPPLLRLHLGASKRGVSANTSLNSCEASGETHVTTLHWLPGGSFGVLTPAFPPSSSPDRADRL